MKPHCGVARWLSGAATRETIVLKCLSNRGPFAPRAKAERFGRRQGKLRQVKHRAALIVRVRLPAQAAPAALADRCPTGEPQCDRGRRHFGPAAAQDRSSSRVKSFIDTRLFENPLAGHRPKFLLRGAPPKLLLISTGNISNAWSELLTRNPPALVKALTEHEFIELSRTTITIHF